MNNNDETGSQNGRPTPNGHRPIHDTALLLTRCILFLLGVVAYIVTQRTPRRSYNAMRNIYGPTNGYFNRAALRILRFLQKPSPPKHITGFLGVLTPDEVHRISELLARDGYAMLPLTVPPALCQQLHAFALSHPSMPIGFESMVQYKAECAEAIRYDYEESSILQCPAACTIAFDGTLETIAETYFKCKPIYDFSAMWWTTAKGKKAYSTAAQKFHFDMDRLFFLKFFIYLTDVHAESGPHVYVSGSHNTKPRHLRDPIRFEDEEVFRHYPPTAVKSICGPAGTIFAADTRALHKGMPVVVGDRLVFQVEFTICKFGQAYNVSPIYREPLRKAGIALPLDQYTYRNPINS